MFYRVISLLSLVSLSFSSIHAQGSEKPLLLIAYYSQSGNTERMAQGVAEGALEIDSVAVLLKPVTEVTVENIKAARGIILGSPTYYANMAAPVKAFIDSWFENELVLFDKVGGAFSTGGGRTAGRETVIASILLAMLNNGMIVAGPHYESWGTFGASAITAPPDEGVSEDELEDARRLGRRIAGLTLRIRH